MYETLQLVKLKDIDHKYDNSFSIFQPKDQNRAFLVPVIKFFCFCMTFYMLIKFEDADFKCDISFLKFQPKIPIKAILVPNSRIFVFELNFVFETIWGCWCKIPQYSSCFEFQPKITEEKQFWSYIYFFFFRKITLWQTEGAEVKHNNSIF